MHFLNLCRSNIYYSFLCSLRIPLNRVHVETMSHIIVVFKVFAHYPAGAAAGSCFLLVSSFFFFLSFWQHVFFTYFPTSDFDQTWSKWPVPWPLLRLRQWRGQRSRWGHWGQNCYFHKKASSPTEYFASMRNLCICISLTPSTKVMVLKIHPGSFGVTGVKRSFSPKRHQVLQNM